MKKKECLIVFLLVFGLGQILAAPCGDVNSNGIIDIVDALMTAQYYVGLDPQPYDVSAADVSGDGNINIVDALQTAQYYVGLITTLEGCVASTDPPGTPPPETIEMQAEDADWENGTVESDHSGYTGRGYVNTVNASGTWIEWSLDIADDTPAVCDFRYASADARAMDMSINGTTAASLGFAESGAWTAWAVEKAPTVNLTAGANTIRLTATSSGGAPNMDKMDLTMNSIRVTAPPTEPPTPPPTASPTPFDYTDPPIVYDVVVARDGSGDYTTVKSAIDAAPDNRSSWYTIYIKQGTYRQRLDISSSKTYLRLLGEDVATTILIYNDASGTSRSATVFVKSKNFIAKNLTISNDYDYYRSPKQAVALDLQADRQIFLNCRITGHQDTLFNRGGGDSRQYFRDCVIVGRTDFMFGDATAVFNDCEIRSRRGGASTLTAPSTNSSAYGLVYLNCRLTTEDSPVAESTNLGRPWSSSGACHYLNCELGIHIAAWSDMGGRSWENARFGEYKSTGPGTRTGSDRPQMSDSEAAGYTVSNIFGDWDPESIISNL